MKNKILFLGIASILLAMLFVGCEGPVGPGGSTGPVGPGGESVLTPFLGAWGTPTDNIIIGMGSIIVNGSTFALPAAKYTLTNPSLTKTSTVKVGVTNDTTATQYSLELAISKVDGVDTLNIGVNDAPLSGNLTEVATVVVQADLDSVNADWYAKTVAEAIDLDLNTVIANGSVRIGGVAYSQASVALIKNGVITVSVERGNDKVTLTLKILAGGESLEYTLADAATVTVSGLNPAANAEAIGKLFTVAGTVLSWNNGTNDLVITDNNVKIGDKNYVVRSITATTLDTTQGPIVVAKVAAVTAGSDTTAIIEGTYVTVAVGTATATYYADKNKVVGLPNNTTWVAGTPATALYKISIAGNKVIVQEGTTDVVTSTLVPPTRATSTSKSITVLHTNATKAMELTVAAGGTDAFTGYVLNNATTVEFAIVAVEQKAPTPSVIGAWYSRVADADIEITKTTVIGSSDTVGIWNTTATLTTATLTTMAGTVYTVADIDDTKFLTTGADATLAYFAKGDKFTAVIAETWVMDSANYTVVDRVAMIIGANATGTGEKIGIGTGTATGATQVPVETADAAALVDADAATNIYVYKTPFIFSDKVVSVLAQTAAAADPVLITLTVDSATATTTPTAISAYSIDGVTTTLDDPLENSALNAKAIGALFTVDGDVTEWNDGTQDLVITNNNVRIGAINYEVTGIAGTTLNTTTDDIVVAKVAAITAVAGTTTGVAVDTYATVKIGTANATYYADKTKVVTLANNTWVASVTGTPADLYEIVIKDNVVSVQKNADAAVSSVSIATRTSDTATAITVLTTDATTAIELTVVAGGTDAFTGYNPGTAVAFTAAAVKPTATAEAFISTWYPRAADATTDVVIAADTVTINGTVVDIWNTSATTVTTKAGVVYTLVGTDFLKAGTTAPFTYFAKGTKFTVAINGTWIMEATNYTVVDRVAMIIGANATGTGEKIGIGTGTATGAAQAPVEAADAAADTAAATAANEYTYNTPFIVDDTVISVLATDASDAQVVITLTVDSATTPASITAYSIDGTAVVLGLPIAK